MKLRPLGTVSEEMMLIKRFKYSEFLGQATEWAIEKTSLTPITLVVGTNSSGKSRLLNAIHGLSKLLSGGTAAIYNSCNYEVDFSDGNDSYSYEIKISNQNVEFESFRKGTRLLLTRETGGAGKIFAAKEDKLIEFQSPSSVIAAYVRRDSVQHPFLELLYQWGSGVRHYPFSTSLGRDRLHGLSIFNLSEAQPKDPSLGAVAFVYKNAFQDFKQAFDDAVIADMQRLGYEINEVGVSAVAFPNLVTPDPLMTIFVQEKNLQCKTTQMTMSSGMFRALALSIFFNDAIFRKIQYTILIDDIGEGLDFERSRSLISVLVDGARSAGFQLLMTTNDRFVMNEVPLEYWAVIFRTAHKVKIINKTDSPEVFSQFEDLGLNNFDFFATRAFKQLPKSS